MASIEIKAKDILDDVSFLFYEFQDVYYRYNLDGTEEILYTEKEITEAKERGDFLITRSPILCDHIIDALNNNDVLDSIFDEIPFYHREPSAPLSEGFLKKAFLSETRDPGVVDVPSVLQTPFWNTWFRDSQGEFHNLLLLNIHNKLKYPFIFENQFINADLFPKLAQTTYLDLINEDDENNFNNPLTALLEFKQTTEDNTTDIENGEQGCLDYLNNIIEEKLHSIYALLDYHPDQAGILSSWAESLYWSGKLAEEDIEREKLIYRLQDIKYELLRRKFAGSSTLYNLSFSAMDRRGSFVNTTSIGNLNVDDSSIVFDDHRIARVLDLPGLLTEVFSVKDYDPINTYYLQPKNKKETEIDLDLLVPLFYTSATVSPSHKDLDSSFEEAVVDPNSEGLIDSTNSTRIGSYNANIFYKNLDTYGLSSTENVYTDYRALFLRGMGRTVNWDSPESSLTTRSLQTTYPKLDFYRYNLELEDTREYRTLDGPYTDSVTGYTYNIIRLDLGSPILRNTEFTSSVMDLSADSILYNENYQQNLLQGSYSYLTYPLAKGNSLSIMDIPWLNYIQASTVDKSRVQDDIKYGVQLSTLNVLEQNFEASYSFFALSFTEEELVLENNSYELIYSAPSNNTTKTRNTSNITPFYSYNDFIETFGHKPSRAFIWYVTIYYKVPTEKEDLYKLSLEDISYRNQFTISRTEVYPVTKISLAIDSLKGKDDYYYGLSSDDIKDFNELDNFNDYVKYNTGILPFTYSQFNIYDTFGNLIVTNDKSNDLNKNKESIYNLYRNGISFIDGVYRVKAKENNGDQTIPARKDFDLFTSLESNSYTKAFFAFSDYNIGNILTSNQTWDIDSNILSEEDEVNGTNLGPGLTSSKFNLKQTNSVGNTHTLKCFAIENIFSNTPSENTKTVYYTIKRPYRVAAETLGKKSTIQEETFTWSSPIPVVCLDTYVLETLHNFAYRGDNSTLNWSYRPDWFQLGYHLNPYLNFTTESASPLRKKDVISSSFGNNQETKKFLYKRDTLQGELVKKISIDSVIKITEEDDTLAKDIKTQSTIETIPATGGPSTDAVLCNLVRTRGLDFLSNDDGRLYLGHKPSSDVNRYFFVTGNRWYDPIQQNSQISLQKDILLEDSEGGSNRPAVLSTLGFYLDRIFSTKGFSSGVAEFKDFVGIYGDNRYEDVYDTSYTEKNLRRSDPFSDPILGLYGLYFENQKKESEKEDEIFNNNFFKLTPFKTEKVPRFILNYSDDKMVVSLENSSNIESNPTELENLDDILIDLGTNQEPAFLEDSVSLADHWYFNRQIKRENGFSIFFNVRLLEQELSAIANPEMAKKEARKEDDFYIEKLSLYTDSLLDIYIKCKINIQEVEKTYIDPSTKKETNYTQLNANVYSTYFCFNLKVPKEDSNENIFFEEKIPSIKSNLRLGFSLDLPLIPEDDNKEEISEYKAGTYIVGINNKIVEGVITNSNTNNSNNKVIVISDTQAKQMKSTWLNDTEKILFSSFKADYVVDGYKPIKNTNGLYEQVDVFKGIVYDLRVYGRPMSSNLEMALTNQGTIREMYSYSPDVFKLAEHVHREQGFFKRDYPTFVDSLPEVAYIRLFNRGTWDSIVVDRYPISTNEDDHNSLQFSVHSNYKHLDTDIFIRRIVDTKETWIYRDGTVRENSYIKEGYELNDAIQQELAPIIEVANGFSPFDSGCNIYYGGNKITLAHDTECSLVTTALQPTKYDNSPFLSNGQIAYMDDNPTNIHIGTKLPIKLPISTVGNTLKYSGDLYPNFMIEASSDLATYITKGTNVERKWNNTLNRATINIKDITNASPLINFVEIPLTIPDQRKSLGEDSSLVDVTKELGLLDKFYIKDFVLSDSFMKFLNINNYYKEFCIPYRTRSGGNLKDSISLKWYGIRQLKEGVYYFTSKIPVKISPFENNRHSAQSGEYPVYYLTARFMVVVKGEPIKYSTAEEEKLIEERSFSYGNTSTLSINNKLSAGNTLYTSTDGLYTHRKISIDLYVMDSRTPLVPHSLVDNTIPMIDNIIVSGENSIERGESFVQFYWKKISSNHDTSVETLSNTIRSEIPLFFTNDLNTPFFTAEKSSEGYNSKIPNVKVTSPIKISWLDSIEYEKEKLTLTANNPSDLNRITLVAGRSYRMLVGTFSKVTELSYSNNADYATTESEILLSDVDILNSYRSSSLIHNYSSISDFMYTSTLSDLYHVDYNPAVSGNDFEKDLERLRNIHDANWGVSTETGSYEQADLINGIVGDPYSKLSTNNILYKVETASHLTRTILDNFNLISYRALKLDDSRQMAKLFTDIVPVLNNSFLLTNAQISLISLVNNFIDDSLKDIGKNLSSNTFGIFKELSYIRPSLLGRASSESWSANSSDENHILRNHYIGAVSFGLHYLEDTSRTYKWAANNFSSLSKSLYVNNLIKNKNFLDTNYWTLYGRDLNIPEGTYYTPEVVSLAALEEIQDYGNSFVYESDARYGRDLFTIKTDEYNSLRMLYKKPTYTSLAEDTEFEVVIVLGFSDKRDYILEVNENELLSLSSSEENTSEQDVILSYIEDYLHIKVIPYREVGENLLPITLENNRTFILLNKEGSIRHSHDEFYEYSATLKIPAGVSMATLAFEIENFTSSKLKFFKIANAFVRNRQTYYKKARDFSVSDVNLDRNSEILAYPLTASGTVDMTNKMLPFVAYKKKDSKYYIPIQFPPYLKKGMTGNNYPHVQSIGEFKAFILGKEQNAPSYTLLPPWVRRLEFVEVPSSTETRISVKSYSIENINGIRKKNLQTIDSKPVFKQIDLELDEEGNEIHIKNIDFVCNEDKTLKNYHTNLIVNYFGDQEYLPITLLNETVSGITNCFYPARFLEGIESPIIVTNVQYLDKEEAVIYEHEFLPISYDETRHHISFNTLIVQ